VHTIKGGSCGIEIGGAQCWDAIKRADEMMGIDKYLPIKSSRETMYSEKP
jgi:hypothetical protein